MTSSLNIADTCAAAIWQVRSGMFRAVPAPLVVLTASEFGKQTKHQGNGRQIQV